jgi:hypothetical protein
MVCAGSYARWLAPKLRFDEQQSPWLIGMMLRLGQLTIAPAKQRTKCENQSH